MMSRIATMLTWFTLLKSAFAGRLSQRDEDMFAEGNQHETGHKPHNVLTGYDYIVVGSGPGGAPLAARLGLAGFKVLVIEAGEDKTPTDWNITVPYLNAKASEDPSISWSFIVNHYSNLTQAVRDPKYIYQLSNGTYYTGLHPPAGATPKGTFYPRSAAVGGCVAHNALIMFYPPDDDWTAIANLTGDTSWNATGMRKYFQRLEANQYVNRGTIGHGFDGWLQTNRVDESVFFSRDNKTYPMLKAAATVAGQSVNSVDDLRSLLDRDLNAESPEKAKGVYNTPLNMNQYQRSSPRNFLVDTAQALESISGHGGRIDIRTDCLATKVVFAPGTTRAIGIKFLDGKHLYRADPLATSSLRSTPGIAYAAKEVILSGGTFNTPQLLKLSGVGSRTELDKFKIPVVVNLPGVGQNLQDRYENSVIANTDAAWTVFSGCTAGANVADPCLVEWQTMQSNKSRYSTNGRPVAIPVRSAQALDANNDLVITGRPGYFAGYFFGYSSVGGKYPRSWTWPVLKAKTRNNAGTINLLSADPLDMPNITFNYFDVTGNMSYDLAAVVEGMKFSRSIFATFTNQSGLNATEIVPGPLVQTDEQLEQWVRDTSWGHHASCSCPIGADDDEMAVLDGKFRVRGTQGLRVVDASVFPTIPGFYIQTSIYMVSEKAADVIVEDARGWRGSGFEAGWRD